MKRIQTLIIATAIALYATKSPALAPTPAPPQDRPIALVGGTAHLGTGEVIEDAVITFAAGKITGVHRHGQTPDLDGHEVIDVSGRHVYPGLVLPASNLGLNEIGSLGDTVDAQETGELNPNVRSIIAYNTDSEITPTTRFNGVLIAQVMPTGGLVSGSSSIVELDAWNWEDAALKTDDGIHVNWPAKKQGEFDFSTFSFKFEPNENYDAQLASIKQLFLDARAYAEDPDPPQTNLKLASMLGLFDGAKGLFLHTDNPADIVLAVSFARSLEIPRVVLMAGGGALEVAAFLAENEVPVIVQGVHNTPDQEDDDIDLPYRLPGLLAAAGLKVGLTYPSVMSARNLPFIAGTAAAYGMGREAALSMITLSNAQILGIADRVGSLEAGKDATLFVSAGDALDMRGNSLSHAFIRGKRITLEGTQQELYRRYHEKYTAE